MTIRATNCKCQGLRQMNARVEVKVKVSSGEALQNMLMYDVTVE